MLKTIPSINQETSNKKKDTSNKEQEKNKRKKDWEKNGYKKISPHPAGEELAAGVVIKL